MLIKIKEMENLFIIMGAGGTGSWLAGFLSKLDKNSKLILIDKDEVELKNCTRQNFTKDEVGMNKAEALAKRYNLSFVPEFITNTNMLEDIISFYPNVRPILVGCLDNNASRKIAHDLFKSQTYDDIIWVDSGNAERSGQTYIAYKENGEIKTPSPLDIDEVLNNFEGDERRPDQISCAEQSESAPQNVSANITAATLLFNVLNVITSNKLLLNNKFTFDTRSINISS